MGQKYIISPPLVALLTGVVGSFIYLALQSEDISQKLAFILLNGLLIFYMAIEINRIRKVHIQRWILNPIVLCSFMTFLMGFGITNIIYFFPNRYLELVGLPASGVNMAMNKLMFLVILGAMSMWVGYWSKLSVQIIGTRWFVSYHNKFFKYDAEPKYWVLPGLFFIGTTSRMIQVWLGVYGYSSNYDRLIEAAAYTQYLTLGSSCSMIALVIATIQFYANRVFLRTKIWFYTIFFTEVFFGLVAGMKSAAVLPFFIVGICQYLRIGRVTKALFIFIPLALVFAYTIVEPFRDLRNEDPNFNATSISNIVDTLVKAAHYKKPKNINIPDDKGSVFLMAMARTNLTYIAAMGIEFADQNKKLPNGSPQFLDDVLLSPFRAWIPRLLWENKALSNVGLWYSREVIGLPDTFSSTAMGIFTNLYFIGGVIAVMIAFFFGGVLQRVTFFVVQPWVSGAGIFVFLSMVTTMSVIGELEYDSLLVTFFRQAPLVLILQSIIYKPASKKDEE